MPKVEAVEAGIRGGWIRCQGLGVGLHVGESIH